MYVNIQKVEWNINDLIDFGVWSTLLPILAYNVTRRGADLLTLRNSQGLTWHDQEDQTPDGNAVTSDVELQALASERSLHTHALLVCSSRQLRGDVLLGLQREQRPNVLSRKNCGTAASSWGQPRNISENPCSAHCSLLTKMITTKNYVPRLSLTQEINDSRQN